MATTVQFVDAISASPAVRCDLNSAAAGLRTSADGIDLTPPEMRRAVVSTLLADGDRVVASAYGNRQVKLAVRLIATTADAAATVLQTLARELDRPTNILKIQLEGMTAPVFFRTFRASDYTMEIMLAQLARNTNVSLAIQAEPFALGLRTDFAAVTVNNDPAAGSNGKFLDVTGIKGDVETPAFVQVPQLTVNSKSSLFAVRRRDTPSAMPMILQAEAMTMGTDTTTTANNALYSGAGNNHTTTTFAGTTSLVERLTTTAFPAAPSVDARGTYRVFARMATSLSTMAFTVQLEVGQRAVRNTAVVTLSGLFGKAMLDLGLVQLPMGADPVTTGPGGAAMQVVGIPVKLYISRQSGSGSVIVDYLMFVPADDRLGIVSWGSGTTPPTGPMYVFDGISRSVYGVDSTGRMTDAPSMFFVGDGPMLSPGVTNRIVFIQDVTIGGNDAVTGTCDVTVSYWPRYLGVRPATT